MLHIYNAPKNVNCINKLRYIIFSKSVASKSIRKKAVNLASLPPTLDAAKYHFFRSYLQTQQLLSHQLPPEEWGWFYSENILKPTTMTALPAPQNIFEMIFCSCKNICGNACSCKKAGLFCSAVCKNCQAEPCSNEPKNIEEQDSEEEIHIDDLDVENDL